MISTGRVRELALALPEAVEKDHFGKPSFRVKDKIFATLRVEDNRAMVQLHPQDQQALIASNPKAFSPVQGKWGEQGSTYVDLSAIDEPEFLRALKTAWRKAAPKKLLKQTDI